MIPQLEEYDLDLSDFLFEELMTFDPLTAAVESGCAEHSQASKLGKRKISTSRSDSSHSIKGRKSAVETTGKLPDEVRTTQFAKYILGEQFKFVPENQVEAGELKLYSFPRFSRYDALFCIPSTMASFMNCGDCESIYELFNSFWHKSCMVKMGRLTKTDMPVPAYLELLRLFLELHPDSTMCAHTTRDAGNEIRSDMYFKCTNNKTIHDSVVRTCQNSAHSPFLIPSRAEWFKQALSVTLKSSKEDFRFKELMDSGSDVEVYAHVDLRICYNKHSKKIMHMAIFIDITSYQRTEMVERSTSEAM